MDFEEWWKNSEWIDDQGYEKDLSCEAWNACADAAVKSVNENMCFNGCANEIEKLKNE